MAYEIVLKKRFTNKVVKLLYYLETKWNKKVADEFLVKLKKRLLNLSSQPYTGVPSAKVKNVRSILITKHNKVFYKITRNKLIVLNMYDSRMNPKNIPY